jgi:hypothetical protein
MRRRVVSIISLLLLLTLTGGAQKDERVGIDILHNGDDRVGIMLVSDLKDEIARSASFRYDSASVLEMSLITIDITVGGSGSRSALSVMFKVPIICQYERTVNVDTRSTHYLYTVGRERTETLAKELLAYLRDFRDKQRCDR